MDPSDTKTLKIRIAKASADLEVSSETIDALAPEVFQMIVVEGLKTILNSRMTKVGAVTKLEGDDLAKAQAAAMAIAEENLEKLKAGEIKEKSKSATKVAGVVMTEAKRLAKEKVKDLARAAGLKVSRISAADLTKGALAWIEQNPEIIDQARANIEARTKDVPVAEAEDEAAIAKAQAEAKAKLAKFGGLAESPKLVAKADKEKKERKASLSATQAGKAKPRARPESHTTH